MEDKEEKDMRSTSDGMMRSRVTTMLSTVVHHLEFPVTPGHIQYLDYH